MLRFVLALSALTVAGTAGAQALWGSAMSGSSPQDVAAAYPAGTVLEPDEKRTLNDGAIHLYTAQPVDVGGKQFSPQFYFLNQRLTQVTLVLEEQAMDHDTCIRLFADLNVALKSKYGEPLDQEPIKRSSTISTWRYVQGRVTVSPTLMSFAFSKTCSIYVPYSTSVADTAKNL